VTTELANYFYDLDRSVLVALLEDYAKEKGAKVRPGVHSVKVIAAYLGHRQRHRPHHKTICVDDSHDQIARALAIGPDAVANALRFLTWAGYLETLKRGGGQSRKPTVRYVHTATPTLRGIPRNIENERDGKYPLRDGKYPLRDAEYPVTPIGSQESYQDNYQDEIEKLNKTLLFGDQPVQALIPHQNDPAPNEIAARMAMEQALAQIATDRAERAKRNRAPG